MRTIVIAAFLAATFIGVTAVAQAQPGYGPGYGQGPGPHGGRGPGVGPDFTPGWGMMSPQERDAHRQQMFNAKTAQECRQIRDEHHKLMNERAKTQGATSMPGPPRDACANFPS